MAIDTREKRASALNPACPWRGIWPLPDGAVTTGGDWAQTDFMYVLAGSGGAVSVGDVFRPIFRPRRR